MGVISAVGDQVFAQSGRETAIQMDVRKAELHERVVPFTAADGMECNLIHVRGDIPPSKGPVILVHGAGVRANIFRAPVRTTFVDFLVAHGYDVWLENWRASIDLAPNEWTLDQAALFDHPSAVAKVLEETGAGSVKAVIHCQGSTSFALSAVAGLLPKVDTIVSNAVSLHPVVPRWSWFKLTFVVPVVALMTRYLNPQWNSRSQKFIARFLYRTSELFHRECDNSVCKQVSFYYGAGFPALWSHENINDQTHEWLRDEFADVPMSFYRQITRCVHHGSLIPHDHPRELPAEPAGNAPRTRARFALFAGEDNLCFLPKSQERTYEYLTKHRDSDSLHIVPGYGHLDMFMGENAARDVFPLMVAELDKPH
jgi:pimeloyl-ACP methyl ester carboxylesterase